MISGGHGDIACRFSRAKDEFITWASSTLVKGYRSDGEAKVPYEPIYDAIDAIFGAENTYAFFQEHERSVLARQPKVTPEVERIAVLFAEDYFNGRLLKRTTSRDLAMQRARAYAYTLVILTSEPDDVRSIEDQLDDVLNAADDFHGGNIAWDADHLAKQILIYLREVHDTVE